jgi:transcriptional regulator with XRE-family HTH domain
LCTPCRLAVETKKKTEFVWHPEEFDALLNESGISIRSFAKKSGMSADPLYRWRRGQNAPRKRDDVERIAAYFDVPVDRLISFPEPKDSGDSLTQGEFNRHVFSVALDLKGMSQSDAARLMDVSHRTVSNWIHGRKAPETPGKLNNLARFLGVSTEDFYT